MKKIVKIFGLILSASLILSSCGGSSSEETTTENQEVNESDASSEDAAGSDCDQFLADYETFVDSYISMAKKIQEDPTDMSAMTEYTSMMSKLTEMQSQGADCNDAEVALKMTELNLKIAQAASSM
jgi:hypothetical protein